MSATHLVRCRSRIVALAGLIVSIALTPSQSAAQNLGPFRQFLAVEPYYTRIQLSSASGPKTTLNGYGGRLWINLAPFVGQSWILPSTGGIALYYSYFPERNNSNSIAYHFGGQHDLFFSNRPWGGVLDPFLSAGVGAFRVKSGASRFTDLTLSPGGGLRVPIPNRLQLRVDARDAIIFMSRPGATASAPKNKSTRHNLELQGAVGITF